MITAAMLEVDAMLNETRAMQTVVDALLIVAKKHRTACEVHAAHTAANTAAEAQRERNHFAGSVR